MNNTYIIFNVSELEQIDFEQVKETSINTVRKSIDGTKTFVNWEGDIIPQCIFNLITKEGPYTYNQIIEILNTIEWNNPI